jgi:ornithine cyclodeaminase/alanine dehydrogenase-like protein (mu-crystallin family)
MPSALNDSGTVGLKVHCRFENVSTQGPPETVSGVVVLLDSDTGAPLALMDAAFVTAMRTAAASAVATRHLARPDATTLSILGAGTIARAHVQAMLEVRPIDAVYVWSRTSSSAFSFKAGIEAKHNVSVTVAKSAREATAVADIVCTATRATTPILEGRWLRPGTHVNAVGAHGPDARELDGHAIAHARLIVDSSELVRREAGEVILAIREGLLDQAVPLDEIGAVIDRRAVGRHNVEEITIYKSLGVGVQDIAAAALVTRRAIERGVGTHVELQSLGAAPNRDPRAYDTNVDNKER